MLLELILYLYSTLVLIKGNPTISFKSECAPQDLSFGLTIINQTSKHYFQGSFVSYACTVGRLIPPNAKQTCINGTWTGIQPKCSIGKCSLKLLKNKKWTVDAASNQVDEGIFVNLTCHSDSTIQKIKCLYGGTWQTPKPEFCPEISDKLCNEPSLEHGSFECLSVGCDLFRENVEIAFQCDSDYKLVGPYKTKCKLSPDKLIADWENLPYCSPLPNGDISGDSDDVIMTEDSGIEKFTILVVVSASLLGALLVIIACVLVCRFTLCRKGFRPLNAPPRDPVPDLAVREVDIHGEENNRHCYTMDSNVNNEANDDRAALINPPSYEEAMRSAGPFHVCGGRSNRLYAGAAAEDDDLSNGSCHMIGSQTNGHDSSINRSHSRHGVVMMDANGSALPSNESARINQHPRTYNRQRERRNQELDSVSRHSTQTSASHGAALSGSIETMAISDGTSVTLRTFESLGSNPSLGSTRPQTGSLGEPAATATCNQSTNHCIYDGRHAPSVCNSCVNQRNADLPKDPDSVSVRS